MNLLELNFIDMYPAQFKEFRDNYRKYANTNKFFVQFTNHAGDVVDKRMYSNPDHNDPMGVYGYPLNYVIKHPADIWYGKNAKFLRVLKPKSLDKALFLQDLSLSEMERIVNKAGHANKFLSTFKFDFKDALKKVKKYYGLKGTKANHKAFFLIMQMSFGNPEDIDQFANAKTQNARFRKAGFDIIIDNARASSTAIINDREPQQIIFLSRGALVVQEVFKLKSKSTDRSLVSGENQINDKYAKIAGQFFERIGDGLADTYKTGKKFWSKDGIEMDIFYDENKEDYRKDLKIGEKRHKYYKTSDDAFFKVIINTRYGTHTAYQDSDQTIGSFVSDLVHSYKEMEMHHDEVEGWQPKSYKSFLMKQANDEEKERLERKAAKMKRDIERFVSVKKAIQVVGVTHDIDFNFDTFNENEMAEIGSQLNSLSRSSVEVLHKHQILSDKEAQFLNSVMDFIDKVVEDVGGDTRSLRYNNRYNPTYLQMVT